MTDIRHERKKLAVHLGETLREARKKAGLTQVDVAERVGLATEVLGRIERGGMLPSVPTLRKLCRALRVDANAVLGLVVAQAPSWLEESEPEESAHPELRRLLRMLREMDSAQLAVMRRTGSALLKYMGQQPEGGSR